MKRLTVWLYSRSGRVVAELQDVDGVSAGATGQGSTPEEALINLSSTISRMAETRKTELFATIRPEAGQHA